MAGIGAEHIAFIVPGPREGNHTLYLKDGTVIVFQPTTGAVVSVSELPGTKEIHEMRNR